MSEIRKFLDEQGLSYLWQKLSLQDYPNNDTLVAIINAIDQNKADKTTTDDLREDIDVLNGTGAGSVKYIVADAIATIVAQAPENFDTLKEIADWIANDETETLNLIRRVEKTETDIENLKLLDVQPDWNAADGEDGHILNRTHWVEEVEDTIMPETTLEYVDDSFVYTGTFNYDITLDGEYTIVWNGVTYTTMAKSFDLEGINIIVLGNTLALGGDDTGELYSIAIMPQEMVESVGVSAAFVDLTGATNLTVKIDGTFKLVHKLSSEFISFPNSNLINGNYSLGSLRTILSSQENADYQLGMSAFAEGNNTQASGVNSHAEGSNTQASDFASHAEGYNTQASGYGSHAEGGETIASGDGSHAEGGNTQASGINSHAEGNMSIASGSASHAEGWSTTAYGDQSHSEGWRTNASGDYSHAEGKGSLPTTIKISGNANATTYTVLEGGSSELIHKVICYDKKFAFITSYNTDNSTIKVSQTLNKLAITNEEAKVFQEIAAGLGSHAEGVDTIAFGDYSHAEGRNTIAFGDYSHAEGRNTQASGANSHAEGRNTIVLGDYSHAEGWKTTASGAYSHAEGCWTNASGNYQHVQGKYNIDDDSPAYVHIVGNGTSDTKRSNAHTLDWNGNAWFAGNIKIGGISQSDTAAVEVATKTDIFALAALIGYIPVADQINTAISNNEATEDEIIELLASLDMLPVITDADGSIFTDENDAILLV